ncbi:MAG: hypothetical protein RLZZ524_441 [Pseudomonadota bacterium]|jgi:hypothetical protein
MPARLESSVRGGWSYWDPSTPDSQAAHPLSPPRLFVTLRSAQNARSAWAQGHHKREAWSGYDWEGVPDGGDTHVVLDVGRKPDDLEIVPATLQVGVQGAS